MAYSILDRPLPIYNFCHENIHEYILKVNSENDGHGSCSALKESVNGSKLFKAGFVTKFTFKEVNNGATVVSADVKAEYKKTTYSVNMTIANDNEVPFNMETFYPSEVARLVLGYLKEEKCLKSWQTFLEESSKLEEYCNLYKKGRVYSTKVNGHSLVDILKEYCELKSKVINCYNNKLKSPEQAYHISESEFLEAIRKEVFLETTKNTIESVFQKYLPFVVLNDQNSSSHNLSSEDHPSKSRNSSFRNKELENSYSKGKTGLNADECCEKQDEVPDIISGINNKNRTCYQDININNLNASKPDTEVNILEKGNNVLKHLKVYNSRHQQSNFTGINAKLKNSHGTSRFISRLLSNHDSLVGNADASDGCNKNSHIKQKLLTSVENSSALNSDCTAKENAISLTESSQNDDDLDIEIIKEIKTEKLSNKTQQSQSKNSQNDLMTNNCPSQSSPVISVENNNVITVNQAPVCSVQPIVTEVGSLKQKVNSSESNPVIRITQVNSLPNEIKQNVVSNSSTEVNQNYNPQHVENSLSDKTNYNIISTSSFINKPTIIDEIQPTSTEYILPNYPSSGSFGNNTQYYIILNTPMNSSVSGTYMTVPGVQTNVSNPVQPAASTTYIQNSVSEVVSGVSNSLSTVASAVNRNSVPASETNLVSAHENFLTTSKVLGPEVTAATQSTTGTSKTVPRSHTRISYTEFLESDPDESKSSVSRKRKKVLRLSPKKKSKSKDSISIAVQPKGVQKAISKNHSTEKIEVLNVIGLPEIQKTPKKRKIQKKSSNNKRKGMIVSNLFSDLEAKKKQEASSIQLENHFACHPTNTSSKNIGVKKSNKVTDCGDSLNSYSDIRDNSRYIVSKTASKNFDQSAMFSNNRVLKVVLSDMFQQPNLEPKDSCSRHPKSNVVQHKKKSSIEDKVSHLNQTIIQSRKSPQKRKVNAGHLSESKSTDTLKLKRLTSSTDVTNKPPKTKRKRHKSVSKNESRNSFDMKAAVLNSMEEARQSVTDPKKYSASVATKELNSQNLFKSIAVEPKSTFHKDRNTYENIKTKSKDWKNRLFTAGNEASLQSRETEDSLKFSQNKSSKTDQNTVNLSCNNSYKYETSNNVAAICCLSSPEDSRFEIHSSLPEKQFEKDLGLNHETREIISLKVSDKSSSDTIDAENEIAVRDCAKEKKMLVTNSLSGLHQVNVSTRLNTCVARELNFGEKLQFLSPKRNTLDKEDSKHLSTEILKAESGTFNSINIGESNSNFIQHTEETSVFSVLTSISTNTKVLGVTEMLNVIKPDPDVLDVSSLRGKMSLTSDPLLDP